MSKEARDHAYSKVAYACMQGDMSKEIRDHLVAEAARAERAEVAAAEAAREMQVCMLGAVLMRGWSGCLLLGVRACSLVCESCRAFQSIV